jgi:FkbM family methyltransferase
LRRKLELNGFAKRCVIAEMALTDGNCDHVEMTIEPGISLAATLKPHSYGHMIEVDTGTLDQLLGRGYPVPSLVKVDVEGAEHNILRERSGFSDREFLC